MKITALLLVTFSFYTFAAAWKIDATHASAEFKIKHLGISTVTGQIGNINGEFDINDKDITKLKIDATLDLATINTNNEKRDTHLKSKDFFDIEKNPTMTFKSTKVAKKSTNQFIVSGKLTMNGVTKDVDLVSSGLKDTMTDPWGNLRRGFSADTVVHRKDFNLTYGDTTLGNDVKIHIELELTQPDPKAGTAPKKKS